MAEDMMLLSHFTTAIRTYSATGIGAKIPALAHAQGIDTWLGAWISDDLAADEDEVRSAAGLASQPGVKALVIGNECLHRKLPAATLAHYIVETRNLIGGAIPVGYAGTPQELIDHSGDLAGITDFVMANIHPFWAGIPIDKAVSYTLSELGRVQAAYRSKPVLIGEVGWPSGGDSLGGAVPSLQNECQLINGLRTLRPSDTAFVFEAFDEPWKESEEGYNGIGRHWGLLTEDRLLKPGLENLAPGVPVDPHEGKPGLIVYQRGFGENLYFGQNTSNGPLSWVAVDAANGWIKCAYPNGTAWGAIFVTEGKQAGSPDSPRGRRTIDLSRYRNLQFEIRGESGGETCSCGIKTETDADDGSEPKVALGPGASVGEISKDWTTITIPIRKEFGTNPNDPSGRDRLAHVYVVFELVFGSSAETVYVRNIRYTP